MFCTSLRKRPQWAPAVQLLAKSTSLRWQEHKLNTHDIALPVPQRGHGRPARLFRMVLLSPSDVGTRATEQRLERLFHLNGGKDVAVLCLVQQQNGEPNPMDAYMKLQIEMLDRFEMPLVPLSCLEALPVTLAAFQRQLCKLPSERTSVTSKALLSQCVVGQPLSEHQTNILSEVASDFRDLARIVSTEHGQKQIVDYLGEVDGHRVVAFLTQERAVFR